MTNFLHGDQAMRAEILVCLVSELTERAYACADQRGKIGRFVTYGVAATLCITIMVLAAILRRMGKGVVRYAQPILIKTEEDEETPSALPGPEFTKQHRRSPAFFD